MNGYDKLDNFVHRALNAQRAVDRLGAGRPEKVSRAKSNGAPSKNRNLKFNRDVHWRTDDDGFEFIARTLKESGAKTISAAERKFWFKRNWRATLEGLRKKHRAAGLKDEQFWHPAKRREVNERGRGQASG